MEHDVNRLIGSMMLRSDCLLNITDNRREKEGVVLVGVDPTDANKERWRRTVKVDDLTHPVVMSYKDIWFDGANHAVFAAGRTVYIVRPHKTVTVYDSVESVSPLEIDDVPVGSWITAISASCNRFYPDEQFLIAISGSSVLREYDVTGSPLRSIETREYGSASDITSLVYHDRNTIATIGHDDVILLSANGNTVQQCGSLRPPSSGMSPTNVLWTGYCWLVLFISNGSRRQWKVVCYTGKQVKVCDEGTARNDLEVPVSITEWGDPGYVTFADNTTRSYNIK